MRLMLPDLRLDCLGGLDVHVTGQWANGRTRDWQGVAAGEPIVAVAFVADPDDIQWCKSERPAEEGQPIRLLLGHHDAEGRDVQVNFSVGHAARVTRTTVESSSYHPLVYAPAVGRTGYMFRFAEVSGSRPVLLGALFIARAVVQVGRNGLWHIRKDVGRLLPEPVAGLLTQDRTGVWAV
jgi:hypothetical protein